jgi:hypothetical protein
MVSNLFLHLSHVRKITSELVGQHFLKQERRMIPGWLNELLPTHWTCHLILVLFAGIKLDASERSIHNKLVQRSQYIPTRRYKTPQRHARMAAQLQPRPLRKAAHACLSSLWHKCHMCWTLPPPAGWVSVAEACLSILGFVEVSPGWDHDAERGWRIAGEAP